MSPQISSELFLAVFRPLGINDGGRLIVDRIPVRDGGIQTSERKPMLAVTLDGFSVQDVRDFAPSIGFKLVEGSVHPVSGGKDFFFDMRLMRS